MKSSVSFTAELSGDGECFCWADVVSKSKSGEEKRRNSMYPGAILEAMGCEYGKRYKFRLTIEELDV